MYLQSVHANLQAMVDQGFGERAASLGLQSTDPNVNVPEPDPIEDARRFAHALISYARIHELEFETPYAFSFPLHGMIQENANGSFSFCPHLNPSYIKVWDGYMITKKALEYIQQGIPSPTPLADRNVIPYSTD